MLPRVPRESRVLAPSGRRRRFRLRATFSEEFCFGEYSGKQRALSRAPDGCRTHKRKAKRRNLCKSLSTKIVYIVLSKGERVNGEHHLS